jgi:hypothetical protein
MTWSGHDQLGDIIIDWNANYESRRDFYQRATKQEWIKKIEPLLPEIQELADHASAAFEALQAGQMSEDGFEQMMSRGEATALVVTRRVGNEKVPPAECADTIQALQQLVATLHNIFVPFASWSRIQRNWQYKEWHLRTYLADFETQLQHFVYVCRKVR